MTTIVVISNGVAEALDDEKVFVWDWDNWMGMSPEGRLDAIVNLVEAADSAMLDSIANAILDVLGD